MPATSFCPWYLLQSAVRRRQRQALGLLNPGSVPLAHRPWRGLEAVEPRILLSTTDPAAQRAVEMFNLSPALFVENRGQWDDESVRFVHNGNGMNVAMTDSGPVFQLFRPVETAEADRFAAQEVTFSPASGDTIDQRFPYLGSLEQQTYPTPAPLTSPSRESRPMEMRQFSVGFVNAAASSPLGLEQAEATFNYQIGDESKWRSEVPSFGVVAYEDLYEGIDLHTWGQRSSLKYEFLVSPGADYTRVQVRYEGIEGLSLAEDGSLIINLGEGWDSLVDAAPYVYQEIDGQRVEIESRYVLVDDQTYTFELGEYDAEHMLVIDPELAWAKHLSGMGMDIAVDGAGNVYVVQSSFVSKFNANGTLAWSSYLAESSGYDIAVDGSGNVYVLEISSVSKFNANGTLAWSSPLEESSSGGHGTYGGGIAVDGAGNVYVTGHKVADGAGFVAKINADRTLAWSSYLAGIGYDIAVDGSGNVFVMGETSSSGWVSGEIDDTYGGDGDAFVAKINANGTLAWSGYLGGEYWEAGYDGGIAVDGSGNVYVVGTTDSPGWTSGGFDTSYNGNWDAFVAKINANGTLAWSSYLGEPPNDDGLGGGDVGFDVAVDGSGNVYVTGTSVGAFVAKINADRTLAWFSYPVGIGVDHMMGHGIAVDGSGNVYVTGGSFVTKITDTIAVDSTPPSNVSNLTATPGNQQVALNWTNPVVSDFAGVVVVRRSGSAPSGNPSNGTTYSVNNALAMGTVVYVGPAGGFTDTGLTNGTTYHYRVFSYDTSRNYASGTSASATPNQSTTYSITPNPATVNENAGTLTFTITRSGSLPAETIYASTTTGEGSSNNGDFTSIVDQAVGFTAGQTSRTVTVTITNDTAEEPSETFGLVVQRSTSDPATTFLAKSTFTVIDNDLPDEPFSVTAELLARGVVYSEQWSKGQSLGNYNSSLNSYTVDKIFSDPTTSFYALGLKSDLYGPALVLQGTDGLTDWYMDSDPRGVGYGQFINNWTTGKNVSQWLADLNNEPVDIAGHSLGGALSQWVAAAFTSSGGKVDEVITFNSPGISNSSTLYPGLVTYAKSFNASNAKSVTHHIVNGDVVSMAGEAYIPGDVKYYSFSDLWTPWDFDKHSLPLTINIHPRYPDKVKPPDLKSTTLSVSSLSSPFFSFTDRDYNLWLAGIQLALLAAGPKGIALAYVTSALRARGTTEPLRRVAGVGANAIVDAVNLAKDAYRLVDAGLDRARVVLDQRYDDLQELTTVTVNRDLTLSADNGNPPVLKINGNLSLDVEKNITIKLPDELGGNITADRLIRMPILDTNGVFDRNGMRVSGEFSVIKSLLKVNGSAAYNPAKGELIVTGDSNFLNGVITSKVKLKLDRQMNLEMGGEATVRFPQGVRVVGGIALASAQFLLKVTNNGTLSDDFLAGWGTLAGRTVGYKVSFDGKRDDLLLGAEEVQAKVFPQGALMLQGGEAMVAVPSPLPATTSGLEKTYPISPGHGWALFLVDWTNSAAAASISIETPAGQVLTGAQLMAGGDIAFVPESSTSTGRVIRVNNPAAGDWVLRISNASELGEVTTTTLVDVPSPSVSAVTISGGATRQPVVIDVNVVDPGNGTRVAIYADTDNAGFDGTLIADGLTPTNGAIRYSWDTSAFEEGTYRFYTVVLDDQSVPVAAYASQAATVTGVVDHTNTPPDLTAITPLTGASEDIPFTIPYAMLLAAAEVSDIDNDPISFRIESIGAGTLTKNGTPAALGVTTLSSGESWVWTPPLNVNGSIEAFTVRAHDGQQGSSSVRTVQIAVAPVNDAPVLNAGIPLSLSPIVQGAASNMGTTVSAILQTGAGSVVSDVDGEGVGIAIIAANTTHGSWQYSLNNGVTWESLGTPSANAARLLRDTDLIRFLPSPNFIGEVADVITFRAWDRTSGTAGGVGTIAATGGTTPYSTATDTANVTVELASTPPSLTTIGVLGGGTQNTAVVISHAALQAASDAHDVNGDVIQFRISSVSSGTPTKDGVVVTPGDAGTLLGPNETLVWTPDNNATGQLNAFTVKAWDGQAHSSTPVQVRVNVAALPVSATPGTPDLVAGSTGDTGVSDTDNLTNLDNSTSGKELAFTVGGTVNGATVNLYAGGTLIGTGTGNGGTLTITTNGTADLADGTHAITARQTEPGKSESAASPALTITVDTAPPTVTINQASGQADPTSTSPINFAVLFSEPVSDFATGDVTLSGTAGATTATVNGGGTTYNVAVSGMTTNGTVMISIAGDKATDDAGNSNTTASDVDDTVSFNVPLPVLEVTGNGLMIQDGIGPATPDSHTDFGVITRGGVATTRTFTVLNTGTAALTTSDLTVPSGFTVTEGLSASIPAGGSDTFTVQLDNVPIGVKGGQISFNTNDPAAGGFVFAVAGAVTPPPVTISAADKTFAVPHTNIKVSLKGAGTATIWAGLDSSIERIELTGTDAKSALTITPVSKTQSIAIGEIVVGDPSNSDDRTSLGSLIGKLLQLTGGLTITGGIKTLTLGNLADQHNIVIGTPPEGDNSALTFVAAAVRNLTMTSGMPIKSIKVADWIDDDATPDVISAPSIGSIASAAAFEADIVVTDATVKSSLNKLTAKGVLASTIRSAGSIGSITAGRFVNSLVFAGVLDSVTGLPSAPADFAPGSTATIGKVTGSGIKNDSNPGFINTLIAAPTIGTVSLKSVQVDNDEIPFGVAADTVIKSFKVAGGISFKKIATQGDTVVEDDFILRVV